MLVSLSIEYICPILINCFIEMSWEKFNMHYL